MDVALIPTEILTDPHLNTIKSVKTDKYYIVMIAVTKEAVGDILGG